MKKYISFLLIAVSIVVAIPFSIGINAQTVNPAASSDELTNSIVIMMLKDGLSPEIVIAKIKTSRTRFDTSPETMQALKEAGVPDSVILGMVESTGMPRQGVPTANPVGVRVPDGIELEVELSRIASGNDLKLGDIVDFSVVQPVVVNGVTIIEKGASARAHITTAKKNAYWGRAGKLEWAMKDVLTIDGNRATVRFTQRTIGDSKGGTVAIAAVATTILFAPLGLLWGLKKGKPAVIPAGNRYPVFIHGDTTVMGRRVTTTDFTTP